MQYLLSDIVKAAAVFVFPDQNTTIEGVVMRDPQKMVDYWAYWYSQFFRSTTSFHANALDDPVATLIQLAEDGQDQAVPTLREPEVVVPPKRKEPLDKLLNSQ